MVAFGCSRSVKLWDIMDLFKKKEVDQNRVDDHIIGKFYLEFKRVRNIYKYQNSKRFNIYFVNWDYARKIIRFSIKYVIYLYCWRHNYFVRGKKKSHMDTYELRSANIHKL